jgi:hypothetical protein
MNGSQAITEEAARAIGVDAYLYFYPLISVDITRKQSTNIEAGKEFGKGPMNTFVNIPALAGSQPTHSHPERARAAGAG